jgi:hypothetical protein
VVSVLAPGAETYAAIRDLAGETWDNADPVAFALLYGCSYGLRVFPFPVHGPRKKAKAGEQLAPVSGLSR